MHKFTYYIHIECVFIACIYLCSYINMVLKMFMYFFNKPSKCVFQVYFKFN